MEKKAWEKTLSQNGAEHKTFAPMLVLLSGMGEGVKSLDFKRFFCQKQLKLENV